MSVLEKYGRGSHTVLDKSNTISYCSFFLLGILKPLQPAPALIYDPEKTNHTMLKRPLQARATGNEIWICISKKQIGQRAPVYISIKGSPSTEKESSYVLQREFPVLKERYG